MSDTYRNVVSDLFCEIDTEIYKIIRHCESGHCDIEEIAEMLRELRSKIY
jgi:predicted transcriptional regulator